MSTNLESLRHEVDQLSAQILELLNDRAHRVLQIADHKKGLGLPIRDAYREAELFDRLAEENRGPFDNDTVRSLFREIVNASLRLMEEQSQPGLLLGAGPRRVITIRGRKLGGSEPTYIAGPCAIEDEEQLDLVAEGLARMGVGFLRGGAFKPRTSPYSFQGLGEVGLRMLRDAGERHDLVTVTEVTSPHLAPIVAEHADVLQIGARNMYNYDLLRAVGEIGKPVLLKRSFAATVDEWLLAAEHIAVAGTKDIILCERGIRTFTRETRNTLDVSAVPLALSRTCLPVVVDVSHAAGRRDILAPLARAALAVGAHGIMVEVHPDPDNALSDAQQQLSIAGFEALVVEVARGLAGIAASCPSIKPQSGERLCDSALRVTSTAL